MYNIRLQLSSNIEHMQSYVGYVQQNTNVKILIKTQVSKVWIH